MQGLCPFLLVLSAAQILAAATASAQDERFEVGTFVLAEAVFQQAASNGGSVAVATAKPATPGVSVTPATVVTPPGNTATDERRVRVGLGLMHSLNWREQVITDSVHAEQARSVAGKQLDVTASGHVNDHWTGPRLGLDAGVTASLGRYANSESAPVTGVLGQAYGNTVTDYHRLVATAGVTYALTRLWQVFANVDLSRNSSLGIISFGEGVTAGTKIYHTDATSSKVQVGVREDWQDHFDPLRTETVSYRVDHSFGRNDRGNIEVGEDIVYTPVIGRTMSLNYNAAYNHTDGDVGYNAYGGRSLTRRPVTNEQTLNDTGGISVAVSWKPTVQTLLVSASRNAERDIFNQAGLSLQTVDTARIEHSIGVYRRSGLSRGRDYDRLVLSGQVERAYSVLGDVRRETYGLGYYASF